MAESTEQPDTLQRLEAWLGSSKSHGVSITRSEGYSDWEVQLLGGIKEKAYGTDERLLDAINEALENVECGNG